ncbi:hypothetical protein PSTG_12572 [Puccinia striiformis f. sp. tritici PST-78]|uniref:Uncharacterized protein n=1 Tax=Puccinia striiformis f. sp. tritici PST-78 TaxID=1165861 RepID=A0A0L0V4F9_9BASI|nr:hypothetical protein PSTG_12572 [Puccinia striiformis f. sp. tritici PST-78]
MRFVKTQTKDEESSEGFVAYVDSNETQSLALCLIRSASASMVSKSATFNVEFVEGLRPDNDMGIGLIGHYLEWGITLDLVISQRSILEVDFDWSGTATSSHESDVRSFQRFRPAATYA